MNLANLLASQSFGLDILTVINFLSFLNKFLFLDWQSGEEPGCRVDTAPCHLVDIVHDTALILNHDFIDGLFIFILIVFCLQDLVDESEMVFFKSGLFNVAECQIFLSVSNYSFLKSEDISNLTRNLNINLLH